MILNYKISYEGLKETISNIKANKTGIPDNTKIESAPPAPIGKSINDLMIINFVSTKIIDNLAKQEASLKTKASDEKIKARIEEITKKGYIALASKSNKSYKTSVEDLNLITSYIMVNFKKEFEEIIRSIENDKSNHLYDRTAQYNNQVPIDQKSHLRTSETAIKNGSAGGGTRLVSPRNPEKDKKEKEKKLGTVEQERALAETIRIQKLNEQKKSEDKEKREPFRATA